MLDFLKKYLSRKLWMTIATTFIVPWLVVHGMPAEIALGLIAFLGSYVLGQAYVDGQEAKAKALIEGKK